MSRTGITFEDVAQAAAAISDAGETPTIDKVRDYLGGTGSNTTISKYLTQWRRQGSPTVLGEKVTPPDMVQAAVEQVWQQMHEKAQEDITAVKSEAQALVEAADLRVQTAETNYAELLEKYNDLEQKHIRQSGEKELLILDVKKLTEEYHLLQERHQALELRYEDMQTQTKHHLRDLEDAQQKEIVRLESGFAKVTAEHEHLLSEIKEQREYERHEYMKNLDAFKVDNKKLSKVITEQNSILNDKTTELARLAEKINGLTNIYDATQETLTTEKQKWQVIFSDLGEKQILLNKLVEHDDALNKFLSHKHESLTDLISTKFAEFENYLETTVEKSLETHHKKLSLVK